MAVSAVTPKITYTGDASVKEFAFTFVVPASTTGGTITSSTGAMSSSSNPNRLTTTSTFTLNAAKSLSDTETLTQLNSGATAVVVGATSSSTSVVVKTVVGTWTTNAADTITGSTTGALSTFPSALNHVFNTSDLAGKTITVAGAGASSSVLTTTINTVTSGTQVELVGTASTTVTGAAINITTGTFATTLKTNADLEIYVDNVLKTYTTHYTVLLNVGDDSNKAGKVIFSSAPADGAKITIKRNVALSRTTDFQTGGALTSKTLNAEFDNVVMAVQDTQFETSGSTVKFLVEETGTVSTTYLPSAASRALKVLSFDTDGDFTVSNDITSGTYAVTGTIVKGTTSLQTPLIEFTDGDDAIVIADGGGVTIANLTATTADVNGGSIDGTTVGATSHSTGKFTTLTSTSTTTFNGQIFPASDGSEDQFLSTDGSGNLSWQSAAAIVSTFLGLTDTPSSYSGGGLKYVRVNSGASALELDDTVITTTNTKTLTNKTLTSPVINTGISGTALLDSDTMSGVSATTVSSSESIKAYVDAQITAEDLDVTSDSGTIDIDLDSDTLDIAGGTGIDTSATGVTVTVAIDSTVATLAGSQTLTNKSIDVDNNTVTNIEVDNLKSGVLDTDISTVAGTDTTLASAKAIKTYVDAQVTAQDLDFAGDSGGAQNVDLDSQSLTIAGGTGIDTVGSGQTLTINIDGTVVTGSTTDTFTNKTFDLGGTGNSLTGSLAEFNTALQSDSFVSLTGSETLTNKVLTTPTINGATLSGTLGVASNGDLTVDTEGSYTFKAGVSSITWTLAAAKSLTDGETLTQATSGATAIVHGSTSSSTTVKVRDLTGTPTTTAGHTLTGSVSGALSTYIANLNQYYGTNLWSSNDAVKFLQHSLPEGNYDIGDADWGFKGAPFHFQGAMSINGTTTPSTDLIYNTGLQIESTTNGWPSITLKSSSAEADGNNYDRFGNVWFVRSGSNSSDAYCADGDKLGGFYASGYDEQAGNYNNTNAAVFFEADGDHTSSNLGGYIKFQAIPNGAETKVTVAKFHGDKVHVNPVNADVDFIVDGDSNNNVLKVDAGTEIVSTGGVFQVYSASSAPGSNLANGQMYYNSTSNKMQVRENGSWVDVTSTGTHDIWIPAQSMYPNSTNGANNISTSELTALQPEVRSLGFIGTAPKYAQFSIAMPKSWNEGTITFEAYWTAEAGTLTNGVSWGLQGVGLSEADPMETAFGTAVVVDDALTALKDVHVTSTSSAVTIGGSPAAGDIVFFQIYRDTADSNDTLSEIAKLIGIKLHYTTDAGNDA